MISANDEAVLVKSHMYLVDLIACQHHRSLRCDLVSAGNFALVLASRSFDATHGLPFKSWAALRIKGAMIDELRRLRPLGRKSHAEAAAEGCLPRHVSEGVLDKVSDPMPTAEDILVAHESLRSVLILLEHLTKQERYIVERMMDGISQQDAGDEIGVGKSWACRIRQSAYQKLREAASDVNQ